MVAIYYFTRSGSSEKAAKKLAARENAPIYRIDDKKSWNGPLGFLKGGFAATRKKSYKAEFRKPEAGEKIILCFPVWASGFPPAVRFFIDQVGRERISLYPTSNASIIKDRDGFKEIVDLNSKNAVENL